MFTLVYLLAGILRMLILRMLGKMHSSLAWDARESQV